MYRYIWHGLYRGWEDRVPFIAHAAPALANLTIYAVLYVVLGRKEFNGIAESVYAGRPPFYVAAIEWAKIAQGLIYAALVLRLLWKHREGLKRWAQAKQRRLWLWALGVSFSAIWLLVLASGIVLWTGSGGDLSNTLIASQLLVFLAFFYMITFFSLRYPSVLDPKETREEIRKKLNLPEGFVEETLRRLKKAETARFFTDPEVTLASLARRLGLH
ncbi:MAG: hypothetical protein RQ801_05675, partial [Spirochaetaceae bacterium]|nr:hypothetical protein [Spirochaetaceae bacterium]